MTGKQSASMLVDVFRRACVDHVTDHVEAVCLWKHWTVADGTARDISKLFVDSLPNSHIAPFHDMVNNPNVFQPTKELMKRHRVSRGVMESLLRRLRDVRMLVTDEFGKEQIVQIFESKGGAKDLFFSNNSKAGSGGITLILRSKYKDETLTGENAVIVRTSTKRATETCENNLKGANVVLAQLDALPAEEKQTRRQNVIKANKKRAPKVQPRLFNEHAG